MKIGKWWIGPDVSEKRPREDCVAEMLKTMQRLDVKDGDILVLSSPIVLSNLARERLKESLTKIMGEYGFKIHTLILEQNMNIGVLRKTVDGINLKIESNVYDEKKLTRELFPHLEKMRLDSCNQAG